MPSQLSVTVIEEEMTDLWLSPQDGGFFRQCQQQPLFIIPHFVRTTFCLTKADIGQ